MSFDISSTEATKYGRGRSNHVDLRWHKKDEVSNLSGDDKKELPDWQNTAEDKSAAKAPRDAYLKNKGKNETNKRYVTKLDKKGDDDKSELNR
mmetsp:Transcript_20463/g.19684  ORF Transcript_20463/g.19684 Transcript_20463/m.19684 type:complete len:93 (+) Transcript_20463:577-855(+)